MNKKNFVFAVALLCTASLVNADATPAPTTTATHTTTGNVTTDTTKTVTPGSTTTTTTTKEAFYKVFYNTVKENPYTCLTCAVLGGAIVAGVTAFTAEVPTDEADEDDNN